MDNLYKRIEELCSEKKINITTMCKEAGISRGSLTDLKSERIKGLSIDTLTALSNYFDVSIDYLRGKTDIKKAPELSEDDEMADLLNEFRDNPDLRVLFSLTKKADPKKLRQYIDVIKALRGSNDGNGDY